jgi:hypothetical protein
MVAEMEEARVVGRDVILRVAILSAAIVGFSATLLSLENVDVRVDETLLEVSWFLFAAAIFVGPVSVYAEARAKYAIAWRAIQAQEFDQEPATASEQAKMLGVVMYSILLRPRNLIFVRDGDYGDKRKAWLNARIIQKLHVAWDVALALELAFWLTFIAALVVLVLGVVSGS